MKITLQDGVYAAAYSDDNGICVRLFKTEEGALKWKQELALQYWDCHFTEPMPVTKRTGRSPTIISNGPLSIFLST